MPPYRDTRSRDNWLLGRIEAHTALGVSQRSTSAHCIRGDMRFASAVTEYIVPGLPVVAILVCGANSLTTWSVRALLASEGGEAIAIFVSMLLLAIAYPLGVMVHCMARWIFRPWSNDQEYKAWEHFKPYCEPKLHLLGSDICHELVTLGSDQLGDGELGRKKRRGKLVPKAVRWVCAGRPPDEHAGDASGWILWRMRLLLCSRAPVSAQEVLHLQAISRAARGAFALPLSLAAGAFVGAVGRLHGHPGSTEPTGYLTSTTDWLLLVALLVLSLGVMRAVRWTYSYRWGVVCRGTIAAFLSLDNSDAQWKKATGESGAGRPAGALPQDDGER